MFSAKLKGLNKNKFKEHGNGGYPCNQCEQQCEQQEEVYGSDWSLFQEDKGLEDISN